MKTIVVVLLGLLLARSASGQERYLAVTLAASTVLDVETSLHALKSTDCREANLILRPFDTRAKLYLYNGAVGGLSFLIAHRMHKKGIRGWWILPTTMTIAHGVAGTWNVRF